MEHGLIFGTKSRIETTLLMKSKQVDQKIL